MDKTFIWLLPMILSVIVWSGCSSTAQDQGTEAGKMLKVDTPMARLFDPLGLPKADDPEPWLDPLAFFSESSYMIRATNEGSVVPNTNALYKGGRHQLVSYFKQGITTFIPKDIGWLDPPLVKFTINEQGNAVETEVIRTTSKPMLDDHLVKLIQEMPAWEPAKDMDGKSIKQIFELSVAQGGGC